MAEEITEGDAKKMKCDGFHQREIINPCDTPLLAKQCLEEFKQICKKLNIKFCLWHGTALGAYRDKRFIMSDHDNDILIILENQSYREILDKLTIELTKLGWEELWAHPEGQCHYFKEGILTDVWFVKKEGDYYIPLTRYGSKATHSHPADSWNKKHFDSLDEIEFMSSCFPIPAYIEEYFTKRYDTWNEKLTFGDVIE